MSDPIPSGGQVENLRDELLPEAQTEDPNKPLCPFKTNYVLSREQEDALVTHALLRIDQISDQLGRKMKDTGVGKGQNVLRTVIDNPNSFMGKRERYTLRYYNHVDDRAKKDTLYEQSNLTASLSQRITMQMVASSQNFFFGQPDDIDWFSTSAVGAEDESISDKTKKHSRWKVDQCGVKYRFNEGLEFAFVRGEGVMKITHQERGQIYKRTATILMETDEEPLLDAHGDYIVQGDSFVDQMAPVKPGILARIKQFITGPEPGSVAGGAVPPSPQSSSPEQGRGGEAVQPQQTPMAPTGEQVLKRDGVTVLPAVPIWKEQVITRRLVTFEGPDAQLCYYMDFLFPLDGRDIQTCDLIAQLYDMNAMQIAQMFRGQYGEGDAAIADMTAAVERLRTLLGETNTPKAAANQPRTDFKETDTMGAAGVPIAEIAECYLTYDADGDGIQEEIMLVLDRKNKVPIYYEYLANVTVRGLRPFYVWRPMAVDGRIYGMGAMELFDPEQEFVDLQINRHNFRGSKAGIVTFWEPSATLEGSINPNLKLNQGQTYTLRDGKKPDDALKYIQLPDDSENLEYLIDLFMQLMQLKSGKINPGDQKMSGLPSSETATGENLITQSGDELFGRILGSLFPGVKSALAAVIDVIYANMNKVEVFSFFNGEADEILSLDPADVRDLAMNVTLELSRTQQRKALEYGDRATALVSWFYSLPFVLQQRTANYARQQLKGFGVAQADKIIDPVDLSAGQPQDVDKPSSVGQMLAALLKAGAPVTLDDINAVLTKAGLPPISNEDAAAHQAAKEEAAASAAETTAADDSEPQSAEPPPPAV